MMRRCGSAIGGIAQQRRCGSVPLRRGLAAGDDGWWRGAVVQGSAASFDSGVWLGVAAMQRSS